MCLLLKTKWDIVLSIWDMEEKKSDIVRSFLELPLQKVGRMKKKPYICACKNGSCQSVINMTETKQNYPLTVYNASAGSGKTYTLASRYVALLLAGVSHRSILAVTFTNKATAEMKQRILNFLFGLATRPDDDGIARLRERVCEFMPTKLDADELTRRARWQLNEVLQDYDHFTVTTIDAFLQMLLGEVARSAHLQTSYAVALDDEDVVNMAIDSLVANQDMLDSETRSRLKMLIEDAMKDEKSWDIRRRLKALARHLRREAWLREKDNVETYLKSDPYFAEYRKQLHSSGGALAVSRMQTLLDEWKETFGETWSCNNAGDLRSGLKRLEESQAGKAVNADLYVFMKTRALRDMESGRLEATYSGPSTAQEFVRRLSEMQELSTVCREYALNCKTTMSHLGELGMLGSITRQVDEINREANRILLSMTPILLRRVLEHGNDTLFVLERAGVRFSHVMIDEFQDTSRLQWENFLPLIDEVLSRGGTTLLVGDVKQSIYRWRGGDWDILQGIKEHELSGFFRGGMGKVEPLSKNFRSARDVVAFNLDFFPKAAEVLDENIRPIFNENYSPERLCEFCKNMSGGYVDLKLYPCKKQSDIEDAVLRDMFSEVVRLKSLGVDESDMMVLVRKSKEASAVSDYLEKHRNEGLDGITLVSSDAFLLKKSLSVQMLVSGLRCLQNTNDKMSWMFLAYHYQRDIKGAEIGWEQLINSQKEFLPESFVALFRDRERLPLYELVESLIRSLLYWEGRRTIQDDSYVFTFMDHLLSFLDENVSDIGAFLDYWDETLSRKSIPTPAKSKGIRVMTIHKAKGLEADTVFLPFCDWKVEADGSGGADRVDFMWCKPKVKPFDALSVIPVVPSSTVAETIYRDDYALEHYRRRIDCLNTLYVAFTRAKNNLLVFARCSAKCNSVDTVGNLIVKTLHLDEAVANHGVDGSGFTAFHVGHVTNNVADKTDETRLTMNRKPLEVTLVANEGRMKFRQSNPSQQFVRPLETEGEQSRSEYVKMGNLCHHIFSLINRIEDVEPVLQNLWKEGIVGGEEQMGALRDLMARCWRQPLVREWFDGSWTLFRECDILKRDDKGQLEARRPDRVMKRGDETVVVDFKFGQENKEHQIQVRHYMNLLKEMGNKKIRGFIWYVTKGTVEEVSL